MYMDSLGDKVYYSYTVHGSHDTIYAFKNYFATVFSVFNKISCIQTDHKMIFNNGYVNEYLLDVNMNFSIWLQWKAT